MPVCPCVETGEPMEGFAYWGGLRKCVDAFKFWSEFFKTQGHFTWRHIPVKYKVFVRTKIFRTQRGSGRVM